MDSNYSWVRNADKTWEDTKSENPEAFSKAYSTGVTNKLKKSSVRVIKKDSYSSDNKAHGETTLDGAKFQLYSDEACTTKATVYNADGSSKTADEYATVDSTFETDYLLSGVEYYLKEIEAPKGYVINNEVKKITVDGGTTTVEFTPTVETVEFNEKPVLGKVAIEKYFNEDDPKFLNPEPGAVFQIYLKKAGSFDKANADYERDEITTDDKGYGCTKDLYCGTYVVHQVSAGPVDTINAKDFEVEVTEDGKIYTYQIKNDYFKAYLKILKKDKNTEKQVLKEGTAYQIYKVVDDGKEEKVVQKYVDGDNETEIDTFVTDSSGEVMTVKELKSGTYRIYETDSALGLHITEKFIEVTINSKLDNSTEES